VTTLVSYFAAAFVMAGLITLVQPRLARNFLKQHALSPVFRNFAVAGRYIEHKEATDLAGNHLALMQRMGVSIDHLGSADTPYRDLA